MNGMRRVGLVINPAAGQGFEASASAAREALARLGWQSLLTGRGMAGGAAGDDALRGLAAEVETLEVATGAVATVPVEASQGRAYTQALIRCLVRAGVDALMVVGGDGTLADAASVLIRESSTPPVFGLGTGSTNAGTLVSARMTELDSLKAERLRVKAVPALAAELNGRLLGVGFNDCVLGFTVVATLEGRLRDVDVREKMLGRNVPGRPDSIGTEKTRVLRAGPGGETLVAQGRQIASLIVGLAESTFIAKALTGGVCLASFAGLPAGCLISDYPLVQVELGKEEVLALPPIQVTYTSLDSSTRIRARGCREGSGLCVDGNPLALLSEEDEVQFSAIESAVRVFKLSDD